MSLRITLLFGAVLTNLVVGVASVAVVPQLTEHIADRKLNAVIVEIAASVGPAGGAGPTNAGEQAAPSRTVAPASVPARRVGVAAVAGTRTATRTNATGPASPAPITRAAVDARPASPGAVPPAAVSAAIEDEFDGKGIARASSQQQLSLAKAVCSALDQGYSRAEILARALQEDGTTAAGVNRFLDVAMATTCPEHRSR